MMALSLFAQILAAPDASGWVGAGLLGCVLYWLLNHHLPAKDKQLFELLQAKDKQLAETIQTFSQINHASRAEFQTSRVETRNEFLQALRDQQTTFTTALAEVRERAISADAAHGELLQEIAAQLESIERSRSKAEAELWKYLDSLGTRLNDAVGGK